MNPFTLNSIIISLSCMKTNEVSLRVTHKSTVTTRDVVDGSVSLWRNKFEVPQRRRMPHSESCVRNTQLGRQHKDIVVTQPVVRGLAAVCGFIYAISQIVIIRQEGQQLCKLLSL
jgi:hypothetical protein